MTSEHAPKQLFRHEVRVGSTTVVITIETIEDLSKAVTGDSEQQATALGAKIDNETDSAEANGLGEGENVAGGKIPELTGDELISGEPPVDTETTEIEHADEAAATADVSPTPKDDESVPLAGDGKSGDVADDKTVSSDYSDEADWGMNTSELSAALHSALQSYNAESGDAPLVNRNISGDMDHTVSNTTDSTINEMQEENYEEADKINPLLAENDEDLDTTTVSDATSEVSVEEFLPSGDRIDQLHPDDPRTIMTWNVSGLGEIVHRKNVWSRFTQLVEGLKPDIVVLQNVKLCESPMIGRTQVTVHHTNPGFCPKVVEKGDGRATNISYDQQFKDGKLIDEIKKSIFRRYHLVHSLASWRIGGQLIFIKKCFTYITARFGLNTKLNAKYHHPEGRAIMLQFKSYNLLCVMSPINGWDTANLKQKTHWQRDLAHLLHNLKDTKAVVLCGYLNWYVEGIFSHIFNSAPEDIDLSDSEKLKMESSPVLHNSGHTGFPGCRPADREGYKWILLAGRLVDSFRRLHPYKGKDRNPNNKKYTSLVYLGDKTRCAVRTNLTLVSNYFMKNVSQCEIIGNTNDLSPSGWRHLPQLLVMRSPKVETTSS